MSGGKKVKYHVPPNILREKCGTGGVDPAVLTRAQKVIEDNKIDFMPFAERFLDRLDTAIAAARRQKVRDDVIRTGIVNPAMELKANGAMFEYQLISDVSAILLNFLESVDDLNDDALDIVAVHRRTLHVIITGRLRGGGGKDGMALLSELNEACERYFKKYKPETDDEA